LEDNQVGLQQYGLKLEPFLEIGKGLTHEISHKLIDSEWDSFVKSVPRGDHLQSSPWAAFKASYGWSPIRIIIKKDGLAVAGVQFLVRRVFGVLKIAQVLQGPVLSSQEPELFETTIQELVRLIRVIKINYLVVVPACDCSAAEVLGEKGFRPSGFLGGPRATLIIDLLQDSNALLHKMRRTTRNNIRIGRDQGIRVREGGEGDLAVFYRLLEATTKRHKGDPESKKYYLDLWKHLEPSNHVRLFLAEYQGEILSGVLLVPFGNTVTVKGLAWSGGRRWLRPNELLMWKAIGWSKENGFRYFDLNGISLLAAESLIAGQALPESERSTATRFKLGFGGGVILLPRAFEFIPNKAMSLLIGKLIPADRDNNLSPFLHRIFSSRLMRKGSPLRTDG
jgi:peptidoglycan pentaglycine glycine transferase (the first glycine)